MSAVALRGVTFRWRGAPRPVLQAVDLELPPASCTWIGGANGAGKTTLLRLLAGVLRPERGEVLRPPATSWMPAASAALYARLDVAGHLELQARLALLQHRDAAIDAAVERFGLGPLLPRRADRLSTGQRQRLRLALAFLGDPQLVLLDEPRASLDEDGAAVLAGAVARATAIGATVVWAAPDPAGVPEDARRLRVHQGTVS